MKDIVNAKTARHSFYGVKLKWKSLDELISVLHESHGIVEDQFRVIQASPKNIEEETILYYIGCRRLDVRTDYAKGIGYKVPGDRKEIRQPETCHVKALFQTPGENVNQALSDIANQIFDINS